MKFSITICESFDLDTHSEMSVSVSFLTTCIALISGWLLIASPFSAIACVMFSDMILYTFSMSR